MSLAQADMFEVAPTPLEYEVHLLPPKYPSGCNPSRCRHEPQFVMCADVRLGGVGRAMEIDHNVCLACGSSLPSTYGGNIFVDLHMLWEKLGWHAEIGARLLTIRNKWARIATHLFTAEGWNGRHERVARVIDPKLTMRLEVIDTGHCTSEGRRMLLGTVTHYDPGYVYWDEAE